MMVLSNRSLVYVDYFQGPPELQNSKGMSRHGKSEGAETEPISIQCTNKQLVYINIGGFILVYIFQKLYSWT